MRCCPSFFASVIIMAAVASTTASAAEQILFIASASKSAGISSCRLDMATGEMTQPQPAVEAGNTGFLSLHPQRPWMYSLTDGDVHAFQIEGGQGKLRRMNVQPSGDSGATHLEVDPRGRVIAVAHYGGGSTSLLPIASDGTVEPVSSIIEHSGKSVHPQRQQKAYAHGVAFSQDGRFVCVADLGTDHVEVYRVTDENKLQAVARWNAAPGAGPRHLTFHPNDQFIYSINELDSTISVLRFDQQTGELTEVQTISTLPAGYDQPNTTAEVVVHPSGKFLYGSNRGHDSTAVFRIDEGSGELELVELEPTQGGHPRFVGMDPTGTFYVAANRDANNLVSFRVNQETGELDPTGHQATVERPMCVVFLAD